MNIDEALAEIEKIYAELPTVECQGLCWNSCGPVPMSAAEHERIRRGGVNIAPFTAERVELWRLNVVGFTDNETGKEFRLDCAALTGMKRCSAYEDRPLMCRIYGAGRGDLACAHGCKVTGHRLRGDEVRRLLARVLAIGGGAYAELESIPQIRQLLAQLLAGATPEQIRRDHHGDMPELRDE